MSHKIAAGPTAPFAAGNTVIVDGASTAASADGTAGYPFKTIQAALNARPTPVNAVEAFTGWYIAVLPGTYEEDLTLGVDHS